MAVFFVYFVCSIGGVQVFCFLLLLRKSLVQRMSREPVDHIIGKTSLKKSVYAQYAD